MHDIAYIIGLTTACCAFVGLLGLGAIRLLRGGSLRVVVVIASLVPVLAVALSVGVNVRAMTLTKHDSFVIMVALAWATVIAAALTLVVGHRVSAGAQAIRLGLRRLASATDDAQIEVGPRAFRYPPAELAALADELDLVRTRLVASRRRELALEHSRSELVAFMSHDLRTPLTGLRALAEGLEDGVVDDVPAAMTRMRHTVDRMSLLVNDLFELSRVTTAARPRKRRLVSLAELAMDVAAESADHARARSVDLCLELPDPNDRLPVLGDADELARAMTNLVANALRHTRPGGSVMLVGDRGTDGQVRMAVEDGCGGIPDSDLAHVFEAGWRGTPSRTPDDGGAGLGLAIARGVVESHAGQLMVENVEGGCRFELALPTAP